MDPEDTSMDVGFVKFLKSHGLTEEAYRMLDPALKQPLILSYQPQISVNRTQIDCAARFGLCLLISGLILSIIWVPEVRLFLMGLVNVDGNEKLSLDSITVNTTFSCSLVMFGILADTISRVLCSILLANRKQVASVTPLVTKCLILLILLFKMRNTSSFERVSYTIPALVLSAHWALRYLLLEGSARQSVCPVVVMCLGGTYPTDPSDKTNEKNE